MVGEGVPFQVVFPSRRRSCTFGSKNYANFTTATELEIRPFWNQNTKYNLIRLVSKVYKYYIYIIFYIFIYD